MSCPTMASAVAAVVTPITRAGAQPAVRSDYCWARSIYGPKGVVIAL